MVTIRRGSEAIIKQEMDRHLFLPPFGDLPQLCCLVWLTAEHDRLMRDFIKSLKESRAQGRRKVAP